MFASIPLFAIFRVVHHYR